MQVDALVLERWVFSCSGWLCRNPFRVVCPLRSATQGSAARNPGLWNGTPLGFDHPISTADALTAHVSHLRRSAHKVSGALYVPQPDSFTTLDAEARTVGQDPDGYRDVPEPRVARSATLGNREARPTTLKGLRWHAPGRKGPSDGPAVGTSQRSCAREITTKKTNHRQGARTLPAGTGDRPGVHLMALETPSE